MKLCCSLVWAFPFFLHNLGIISSEVKVPIPQQLKEKLLIGYDKHERPVQEHNNATRVTVRLTPLYVIDLDEEKSLLTMDTWILLQWTDPRLEWNKSEFNLDVMHFGEDFIWTPEVVIYNSHSSNIDPKRNARVLVYPNGKTIWVPPATLTTRCFAAAGLQPYPMDEHQCNITMGSWTEHGYQLDLDLDPKGGVDFENFANDNPRWEVVTEKTTSNRNVTVYDCCVEPYVSLVTSFLLRRRFPTELIATYGPLRATAVLALALFWVPVTLGSVKLILGGVLYLSLLHLHGYVAAATRPAHAHHLAVAPIERSLITMTIVLVLQVLVVNLVKIRGPPPRTLVQVLRSRICKWMLLLPCDSGSVSALKEEESETETHFPPSQEDWNLMATVVDRILFVIFAVVFGCISP